MSALSIDQFWQSALLAIPLAAIVAATCRCLPCRPATRHTLWLTLLVLLVVAPLLPRSPAPDLTTLIAVAETTGASVSEPQTALRREPSGSNPKDHLPALRPPEETDGIHDTAAASVPWNTPVVKAQGPAVNPTHALPNDPAIRLTPGASRQERPKRESTRTDVESPVQGRTFLSVHRHQQSATDGETTPSREPTVQSQTTPLVSDVQPADTRIRADTREPSEFLPATSDTAASSQRPVQNPIGDSPAPSEAPGPFLGAHRPG
jgi:hypothetical protein